jgi:threonine-phosphate decarboxylase
VARETGRSVSHLIDFSASINPLGPSPAVLRALAAERRRLIHYPDPDCVELREALAAHYGLAPDQFLLGNGSTELIHLLPKGLGITRALIVGPTFSEYARAVEAVGGRVMQIRAMRSESYRPPVEQAIAVLRTHRVDALFLCNPNSPTGQGLDVSQVSELLRVISRCDAWVILDETFIEYCEERSVLDAVTDEPRLLILRSFTKFYGLPGIRLGYLVGRGPAIRRIKKRQPPWSVNVLAQAAGLAALRDRRHARKSVAFMELERPRLARSLGRIPGVKVYPSVANFLLVELPPGHSATELTGALRQKGLLVRDCSTISGLTNRALRIAVKTRAQNRRLAMTLRRLLMGEGVS